MFNQTRFPDAVAVDIGANIARASVAHDECMCTITPTGKFFILSSKPGKHVNRLLLGREALILQGLAAATFLSSPSGFDLALLALDSTGDRGGERTRPASSSRVDKLGEEGD